MIIWLNGTFGAGKTTTARHLVEALPDVRLFDPEYVGYMVAEQLRDHEVTDFQQLEPWRALVPVVMAEVMRFTGEGLVAPQSVLVEQYWRELRAGLTDAGLEVFHVVLHVDPAALENRIRDDAIEHRALGWRLGHLADYTTARAWMVAEADLVVDSTALTPAEVSAAIASAAPR